MTGIFENAVFKSPILTHVVIAHAFPAKEPKDNQKEKENFMQVVGSATASKPNTIKIEEKGKGNGTSGKGVSSNAYASGSSQNTGNVITDRPSSRVTQPPGGKSSISFY